LYRGRIYVFPIEAFNPFSLIINYSDQKLVFEKSTGIKNAGELQSVTTDLSVAVLQFVTHHWSVKLRISSELPVVDKKNRNYEDLNLRPMIFVGLANDKSFPLEIRTFNGVDRLSCTEGITKKVSSILSEKGVPKHLRRLWPLILLRNNITWVGGFRCSSPFSLNENNGPFLIIEISSCE
jgi:tRNA(Ile)-lysidine synthetase-like protein